jgi:hypothetical protein
MTAAWYSQSGCVSRKSAWACEYSFIKVLIVAFYFSFVRIDNFVCEDVGHKIGANVLQLKDVGAFEAQIIF